MPVSLRSGKVSLRSPFHDLFRCHDFRRQINSKTFDDRIPGRRSRCDTCLRQLGDRRMVEDQLRSQRKTF